MSKNHGLIGLVLLLTAIASFAAETPIPSAPTRFVTDEAGFMSVGTLGKLDAELAEYSRQTGNQLIVYIGKTTGNTPIEDWAVKAFEKWKVGRKGLDNGAALFIFSEDRKLRIEVGYGFEGTLPDGLAGRIINDVIVPKIKAGERDAAVVAGVAAMAQVMGGKELTAGNAKDGQRPRGSRQPLTRGQLIIFGVVAVGFILLLITNPSLAMLLLFSFLSGGRGGGFGGGGRGGGGFSGGGGRSGGGGASGSW